MPLDLFSRHKRKVLPKYELKAQRLAKKYIVAELRKHIPITKRGFAINKAIIWIEKVLRQR